MAATVFVVVMTAAILGGDQAGGPGPGDIPIAWIMVAAYSLGAYSIRRLVSLGALVAAAIVVVAIEGDLPPIPREAVPLVVLFPVFLFGNALRTRQREAAPLKQGHSLERERETALQAAIAGEQARIARELHDVVAYSVSVMIVQAGAARKVLDVSPEETRLALLAVESTGRDAMSELRKMLGLLTDRDADSLVLTPQPGLDQIEPLVKRVERQDCRSS